MWHVPTRPEMAEIVPLWMNFEPRSPNSTAFGSRPNSPRNRPNLGDAGRIACLGVRTGGGARAGGQLWRSNLPEVAQSRVESWLPEQPFGNGSPESSELVDTCRAASELLGIAADGLFAMRGEQLFCAPDGSLKSLPFMTGLHEAAAIIMQSPAPLQHRQHAGGERRRCVCAADPGAAAPTSSMRASSARSVALSAPRSASPGRVDHKRRSEAHPQGTGERCEARGPAMPKGCAIEKPQDGADPPTADARSFRTRDMLNGRRASHRFAHLQGTDLGRCLGLPGLSPHSHPDSPRSGFRLPRTPFREPSGLSRSLLGGAAGARVVQETQGG